MRAKSVALLLLALGCGLVASIGITQVIGNRKGLPSSTGETTPVFVAMEDVPFGELLTPQVVRLENWPKDKTPAGALSQIEDLEGRRARAKLYAGEPVLENKLFAKGAIEQGYSTVIPQGSRVVSVKVDKVSGSGLILPGDHVDVLVHLARNPSRGILETSTRTILQDVKVFAVNDVVETEGQGEKKITAQTISLLVTPEHAQLVMMAEELGKIRLIMRSPEDDKTATVQGSSPNELLGITQSEDRQDVEPSPAVGPEPAANGVLSFLDQLRQQRANQATGTAMATVAADEHHMQIVAGSEVRDVILRKEGAASESGKAGIEWWRLIEGSPAFEPVGPGPVGPEPASTDPAAVPQDDASPPGDSSD